MTEGSVPSVAKATLKLSGFRRDLKQKHKQIPFGDDNLKSGSQRTRRRGENTEEAWGGLRVLGSSTA
jgi:hypothetical protein